MVSYPCNKKAVCLSGSNWMSLHEPSFPIIVHNISCHHMREEVVGDIDRHFDSLSGNRHQSHVVTDTVLYCDCVISVIARNFNNSLSFL